MGQQADNSDRDIIQPTATREPRAGYHRGGPTKFRRDNASACVKSCFHQLIPNVEDACRQLQQPEYQQTHLWDLYCCDSVNCGVYIGSVGQSPNVDLIINKCQNIGYFSIEDPGPPASNYCTSSMPNTINSERVTAAADSSSVPATRTRSAESIVPVTSIHTSEVAVLLTPTSIISSNPIKTGSPATTEGSSSSGLPGGAKAAIAVFSIIAALAIAALALLLFRKQRKTPRNNPPGPPQIIPYGNRPYPGPNSGSGTPLITPPPSVARDIPLAPPAKLSDRRYLQPIFKPVAGRRSASAGAVDQTTPSSSTIRDPTQSRLKPLHERRAAKHNNRLPNPPTIIEPTHYPQSSVYSLSSAPGASTVTVASNKAGSIHSGSATIAGTYTPPLSPARFPRAHDGLHESSDYVTPAGPPPSRALPAPPSQQANSPTFSVSPVSPQSPTFAARSLNCRDSYMAHSQNSGSTTPPISTSTKELRELTESYARETRESWGSWSGVGGGGPGVSPVGRKRRSRSPQGAGERTREGKSSVTRQELDLEKLSGRY